MPRIPEVLMLAGEVLLMAVLTGVIMFALLMLAGARGRLGTAFAVCGLIYGVVAGVVVVVMALVVR